MKWLKRMVDPYPITKIHLPKRCNRLQNATLSEQIAAIAMAMQIMHLEHERHPLKSTILNPYQKDFVLSSCRAKELQGGNRSGKTTSAVIDICLELEGQHPSQLAGKRPMPKWLNGEERLSYRVLISSFKNIKIMYLEKFEQFIKKSLLIKPTVEESFDDEAKVIRMKDGSFIQFVSHKQKNADYHGAKIGCLWIDEIPKDRKTFIDNYTRLIDTPNCKLLLTYTNEEGDYSDVNEIGNKLHEHFGDEYKRWNIATADNMYVPKENIELLGSILTDEEKQLKLYGENTGSARIYSKFKDEFPYVIPPFPIPANWTRYIGFDYHLVKTSPLIFLAVSPDDKWIVYKETFAPPHASYEEIVNHVEKEKDGLQFQGEYGDRVTLQQHIRSKSNQVTNLQEFHNYGWRTLQKQSQQGHIGKNTSANIIKQALQLKQQCSECGWLHQYTQPKTEFTCQKCRHTKFDLRPKLMIFHTCQKLRSQLPKVLIKRTINLREDFDDSKLDCAAALRIVCGEKPFFTQINRKMFLNENKLQKKAS